VTTFRCNLWLLLASVPIFAQVPDPPATDGPEAAGQEREISWKKIVPDFLDDQKHIWLFPSEVARGYHLVPTAAVLGVSAGLTLADPIEGRYFRANSGTYHGFNQAFTGTTTTAEILAAPLAFYLVGRIRNDSYAEHTALLSALAVADAEIPNVVLRTVTRRLRPADVPTNGNFSDTWFDAETNPLKAKGSFASGHAASAFAVATVVSRRYPHHRWVPYVAYGTAGLLAFSRVSSEAHFLSDTFFGSALGFAVGRFVLVRQ
jgi:membrane-associated phospholipid phosphatase